MAWNERGSGVSYGTAEREYELSVIFQARTHTTCDTGESSQYWDVLCGINVVCSHDSTTRCHGDGCDDCGKTSNGVGLLFQLDPQ